MGLPPIVLFSNMLYNLNVFSLSYPLHSIRGMRGYHLRLSSSSYANLCFYEFQVVSPQAQAHVQKSGSIVFMNIGDERVEWTLRVFSSRSASHED